VNGVEPVGVDGLEGVEAGELGPSFGDEVEGSVGVGDEDAGGGYFDEEAIMFAGFEETVLEFIGGEFKILDEVMDLAGGGVGEFDMFAIFDALGDIPGDGGEGGELAGDEEAGEVIDKEEEEIDDPDHEECGYCLFIDKLLEGMDGVLDFEDPAGIGDGLEDMEIGGIPAVDIDVSAFSGCDFMDLSGWVVGAEFGEIGSWSEGLAG